MGSEELLLQREEPAALRPEDFGMGRLFWQIREAVIVADAGTGRIVLWNPAAETLFGYSAAEARGLTVDELVPDRLKPRHLAGRTRYAATGHGAIVDNGAALELPALRKTGEECAVELTLSPIDSAAVAGRFVLAILRDVTERKRVEAERARHIGEQAARRGAEAAERRVRLLLESTGEGIFGVDLDGRFTFVSQTAATVLGYTPDDLVGRPVHSFIHHSRPDGSLCPEEECPLSRPLRDGRECRVDGDVLWRRDGTAFPVAYAVFPIVEDGRISGAVVTFADITERRRAEAARTQLAAIVESSDDAIISKTLDGIIVSWNPGAERMYSYTAEEVVGRPITVIVPPDRPHEVPELLARLKRGERIEHFETVRVRKDGSRLDVSLSVSPLRDSAGRISGAATIARDITQRRHTDEAQGFLGEASALLAASLDYETTLARVAHVAVPRLGDWCAVDVLDEDGSVRRLAVAHVDPAKVAWARELQERYPPDPDAPRGVYQVLRTGRSEFYPEIPDALLVAAARDAEHLRLLRDLGFTSAMVVPLLARGRTLGAITLVSAESGRRYRRDDLALAEELARRAAYAVDNARLYAEAQARADEISRLNAELEQRVRERTAQLEATNKELESFSYSVSHDLRAPLRSIDGFSQALLEDYGDRLDEEGQDYLRRVRLASQRMAQLIDDLLNLSRLTRAEMRREMVDLSALAREIAAELRRSQRQREATFVIAGGLVAEGDGRLLRIALENLLGNAWKFTAGRPHARIEFGATTDHDRPVYFVRDNGAGFDMAYADKLFGAFQRLHAVTEFEGTGIGVATVQRIIHRHGGRIWAEGAVDQGATFYFTL